MSVKFTYLGGMNVLIEREDGFKIVCDPYITGGANKVAKVSDLYDVDVILVTHAAFDHFGDTIDICRNSNCIVCGGAEVLRKIRKEYDLPDERWHGTTYGDRFVIDEITVSRTVFAQHGSIDNSEGIHTCWPPYGFVVQIEPGVTYYHTGDTYLYSDMKMLRELYKPNVMCVGISGITTKYSCEMSPREAAQAVGWVGADVVIPTHYPPGSPDFDKFIKHVESFSPDTKVLPEWNKPFIFTPSSVKLCE